MKSFVANAPLHPRKIRLATLTLVPLLRPLPLLALLLALTVPSPCTGQESPRPPVLPIPNVSLEAMEPAVREQLEQQRASLESLARASEPADPPRLATAYGQLGELYLLYDLGGPAEAALQNAANFQPQAPRWWYLLGTLSELNGDSAIATERYQRALNLAEGLRAPTSLIDPIKARLGRTLLQASRNSEALPYFDALSTQQDFAALGLYGRGRIAAAAGDHAGAVKLLAEALAKQPQANQIHYQLGLSYRALDQLDQARFHLANRGDGTVSFPDPIAMEIQSKVGGAGAMLTLGRISLATGEIDIAEQRFREAIRIDPTNSGAHQSLAGLLQSRGDSEGALAAYEEATRVSPDDAGLRYFVAQRLLDSAASGPSAERPAQLERANRHLDEALLLAPDSLEVRVLLARTQLTLGRFAQADQTYLGGLDRDPSAFDLHYMRAQALADRIAASAGSGATPTEIETYGAAGRGAVAEFLRGLTKSGKPLAPAADVDLGLLQLRLGDSKLGRQRLAAFVAASSEDPSLQPLAARAAFYIANEAAQRAPDGAQAATSSATQLALDHFQRAIDLDPSFGQAYFNYGTLLGRLERYSEAAAQYRALAELEPENQTVRFSGAMALVLGGRHEQARAELEEALEDIPSSPLLGHLLARLLVASPREEVRDGAVGLDLAFRLFEAFSTPEYAETVAMALAETGQFGKAVEWQTRVIEELSANGGDTSVAQRRLINYQALTPVRSPWLE